MIGDQVDNCIYGLTLSHLTRSAEGLKDILSAAVDSGADNSLENPCPIPSLTKIQWEPWLHYTTRLLEEETL
jgi:hypothetical protein